MNLRVAIHAAAALPDVDNVLAICGIGHQRRRLTGRGRAKHAALATDGANAARHVRRVALLAQHGWARFQHARDRAAVRTVAIRTVFANRFMRVHERAALFRVAGVAGIVKIVALGQLGAGRAVHIVAIGASHLAFRNRVVRWFVLLGPLFLVAGVAQVGLRRFVQRLVAVGVYLVASVAGDIGRLVLAAGPQRALGVLVVATLASLAAIGSRYGGFLAESHIGLGSRGSPGRLMRMGLAGAMTADAVRRPLICGKGMRRLAHVR